MSAGDTEVEPPQVTCGGCGASRPGRIAKTVPRPPCSVCGSTAIAVRLGIAEELDVAESISIALEPGEQSQAWRARWADIERALPLLLAPRTLELSGASILAARADLLAFFVRSYHLKDELCAEATSLGLTRDTVEQAITADPELALLADLANVDKHLKLNRPPRSGDVPVFGKARGVREGQDADGWRLELPIHHHGIDRDALGLAGSTTDAWKATLAGWGLL